METINEIQEKYVQSLNEMEKQGYIIAKEHLGSSFSLEKSIGFKEWLKKQNIMNGMLNINILHTSASLVIQENADPDVLYDLKIFFMLN